MENKDELQRVNVRISKEVQDYWKDQGNRYGVPYTNLMAMRLTEIYENDKNKEILLELNQVLKEINKNSGNIPADEMLTQMKNLIEDAKNIK